MVEARLIRLSWYWNTAGRTIRVQINVNAIAMDRSSPMLAVPRCGDSIRLPKDATVVSAAKRIALGVDVPWTPSPAAT